MTKKKQDAEEILIQLFEDGFASTVVDLIPGKTSATLKTIGSKEQLVIEKEMESVQGSGSYVIHTYSLKLLSFTLLTYGNHVFANRAEAATFIDSTNLSSVVVDKLVKSQNLLEKAVRQALNMTEIDKVFFAPAPPLEEQKPLSKE